MLTQETRPTSLSDGAPHDMHTHPFEKEALRCWLWPPDLWRSTVHCYVRMQDMWKWPAQYTAPPRTSSATVRASAGPARVASHRAPQSQAPTRAITRDVSTTDRRFEGRESNKTTMISQNRAVTPRLAEVVGLQKWGRPWPPSTQYPQFQFVVIILHGL